MALTPFYDRVKETTTTTGTGTITVAGAQTGYKAFQNVLSTGDSFYYCIQGQGTSEWEVGIGTMASSTTFTRDTILSSSNSDTVVTFSAGTKDVFLDQPSYSIQTNGQDLMMAAGNFTY